MIQHIGIIMDGNRRWAKKRGKLALFGHKAGFDNAVNIAKLVAARDIPYLTLWALSTENMKNREKQELKGIIGLIELLPGLIPIFQEIGSVFEVIGDIEKLPKRTQNILDLMHEKTKNFGDKKLILALVYGGQDEIIRGIQKCVADKKDPSKITIENFRNYLDTGKYPPADLIIRTGGDIRHSGFLLYDCAYSEYFFSEKMWPDFDETELDNAISHFNKTKRNFGK